jgi:hypothetical protein
VIGRYRRWLASVPLAERSKREYARNVEAFCDWLAEVDNEGWGGYPLGCQRCAFHTPVAVFDDRLLRSEAHSHDHRTGAVRRRQRQRLRAPRAQSQRRVLQLRLGRAELRHQLAQQLGVRMQGVAGCVP